MNIVHKWQIVFVFAFAAAFAANAGHVAETLSLSNGWNAVYIESTPDGSSPGEFFADMPQVQRVGCYESSVYGATEQIASDGTTIGQKPVAFYVWERGKDDESTLQRILGGRCYMIYTTGEASKTFYGVPACPRVSWQAAADGFMTIAGVSIPAGETVQTGTYFREGPLSSDAMTSRIPSVARPQPRRNTRRCWRSAGRRRFPADAHTRLRASPSPTGRAW